jgi:hypothetical protein
MQNLLTLLGGVVVALINTGVLLLFALFARLASLGGTGGIENAPALLSVQGILNFLIIITSLAGVVAGWVWALKTDPPAYWKVVVLVAYVMLVIGLLLG